MISKTIGYNGVHYFQTHPNKVVPEKWTWSGKSGNNKRRWSAQFFFFDTRDFFHSESQRFLWNPLMGLMHHAISTSMTYYDPNSPYYMFILWFYNVLQPMQPILLLIHKPVLYGHLVPCLQESESCKAKEVMEERCSTVVNLRWCVDHQWILVVYSSTTDVTILVI